MKARVMPVLLLAAVLMGAPAFTRAPARAADEVTLDVRGLDIDNLLQFYSRTFGLTVVKDPGLTGPVTIMCPQPVSRQEALDILNSVLEVRGFTTVLRGSLLKIVPVAKAVQSSVGLSVGREAPQEGDQVITRIIPLQTADAAQLQAELTPLVSAGASLIANSAVNTLTVTDYASNIARLLQIIEELDAPDASQVRVFPLTYAQAEEVATLLNETFFAQPRLSLRQGAVSPDWQQRLMGAASAASGGRSPIIGGPIGQVVADSRTNSVLVSTSKERMEAIAQVIAALDKPVEYQGTLNVISLSRANATEVANALNQALGGRAARQTTPTSSSMTGGRQTTRTTTTGRSTSTGAGATRSRQAPSARAGQQPAEASAGRDEMVQIAQVAPPSAGAAQTRGGRDAGGEFVNVLETAGNVSVVAEPNTNSLIINAPPEYMETIRQLIGDLDQAPPQVLIEAIVAEVALGADRKLGFEWTWTESRHLGQEDLTGTLGTNLGLDAEDLGFRYTVAGVALDTLLHALATDSRVSILSTPRIFTSNNRAAEINISTQSPYVSTVRTTETTETFGVQYLDVGVILQVTPQISRDGTVTMQVVQEANELLGYEQFGETVRAPIIARRSAQATILVGDGQTVVLGGIIRDNQMRSVSKVPLLGDLPLLGNFFRQSTVTKEKSELIVFLTPRVVRTEEEAAAMTESQRNATLAPLPRPQP